MVARTARMLGFEVNFPMGIDRNGLPVETAVEKEQNVKMHEMDREKFNGLCKQFLDKVENNILEICKRLGFSCDLENYYQTDNPNYRKITQATFIELWKKGLVYQDEKPNNYCTVCGTTIADAEIEYKELPTDLVYMKFKIKETGEILEIATTRPELLCACKAVLVHPEDKRYTHLHDKHIVVPLFNLTVPIISHPAAKPEFGTGAMMVCSYGDYSDVRLFRELNLEAVDAIDAEGKMTKAAGKYAGLSIKKCREAVIEDMKKNNMLIKQEQIMHRTPTCWRSHNPVEFVRMKEFYLKQLDFLDEIKKVVEKIKFHPIENKQLLVDWINSVTIDWAISRRRYYGTEIPIWYCKNCGEAYLPKPGEYYQPWKQEPPFKKCKKCGKNEFAGEERVFDTWMDSSISELVVCGYQTDSKLFKNTFPCYIRTQGKEIVRTWLYYTLLRAYQLFKTQAFKHVWISGLGLDGHGKAMHKSLGNVTYPEPIIEKYGADAFRLWGASEVSVGSDFRYSDERVMGTSKFLTKLWNVARFISMFPQEKNAKLADTDKWILAELDKLIEECMKGYEDFNFFIPANKIREFTWNLFASHYLEMVKTRAYAGDKSALYTLHSCLKNILLLLAPITPFISEHVWLQLYGKESIHLEKFPKTEWKSELTKLTEKLVEFNSKVWNTKKEKGLSLKDKIEIEIPKELKIFEKDLTMMHNLL